MSKRCELQKEYYQQYGNYKGKGAYRDEYVRWLENEVLALRQPAVIKSVCPVCKCIAGSTCAHSWHYDNKNNWNTG